MRKWWSTKARGQLIIDRATAGGSLGIVFPPAAGANLPPLCPHRRGARAAVKRLRYVRWWRSVCVDRIMLALRRSGLREENQRPRQIAGGEPPDSAGD